MKSNDFGVQSWCFRETKTNPELARKVREIGVDKIEICGVHADCNKPSAFKEVVQIHRDAGVSIISLGVQTFVGAASERDWFECAALAGAKHISAHFKVDSFSTAVPATQKLAQEFGIRVGIHCHGGYMFGGSPDVLEYLMKLGAPEIGLCIDTAWCLQIGPGQGKPVEWAKKYASQLYGIHFKDFVFAPDGAWRDTIVGEGNLELPAFTAALEAEGFDGMAVLEYESEKHDPVPALKNCVAALRRATGANTP